MFLFLLLLFLFFDWDNVTRQGHEVKDTRQYSYFSTDRAFLTKTSRTAGEAFNMPITCSWLIARSARSALTSSAKLQIPTTSIFRRLPVASVFSSSARS